MWFLPILFWETRNASLNLAAGILLLFLPMRHVFNQPLVSLSGSHFSGDFNNLMYYSQCNIRPEYICNTFVRHCICSTFLFSFIPYLFMYLLHNRCTPLKHKLFFRTSGAWSPGKKIPSASYLVTLSGLLLSRHSAFASYSSISLDRMRTTTYRNGTVLVLLRQRKAELGNWALILSCSTV